MKSKLEMQARLAELLVREERGEASNMDLEEIKNLRNSIKNIGKRLTAPVGVGAATTTSSGPFGDFGTFLQAVHRAGIPGGVLDPRLGEIRAASGLSEAVPSEGGYPVQADIVAGILKETYDTGLLASRCRTIELSSNSNRLEINAIDETSRVDGSRLGGIRGYWADEAAEKTKSKPKFRKLKLKLNKLIGLCYATDELLADVSALEGVIRQGFADEFGFKIDDAIINGTGAGMPLGIINAGCLVTQAKESAQTAATIVYNNLTKMWSRLMPRSEQTAVWLINKDCIPSLATMSVDGSGNSPVYLPAGGATARPYATIFGRPVLSIEQCQTLGTAGDIYLCDFSNYVLARKGGIQADMSIHVRFIYDESVFRFVVRIDGQPILSAPITPFKGSGTMSHFINLATRAA
jgi:HK97 family phage major capsid protein